MNKTRVIMSQLVIIPTYNEKENIEAIITAVMGLPTAFHVLVIDDAGEIQLPAVYRGA